MRKVTVLAVAGATCVALAAGAGVAQGAGGWPQALVVPGGPGYASPAASATGRVPSSSPTTSADSGLTPDPPSTPNTPSTAPTTVSPTPTRSPSPTQTPSPSPAQTPPTQPIPTQTPAPTPVPSSPSPPQTSTQTPTPAAANPLLPALRPPFDTVVGFHGSAKTVYLTFDDGPGPQTGQVLDVLKAAGVRATFCQVGNRVGAYPAVERRIVAEGHTLCNHSWDHPDNLAAQSSDQILSEMTRTQTAIAAQGVTPRYFRSPGGSWGTTTTTLRQAAQAQGLTLLGWGIDSEDWREPGAPTIVTNVMSHLAPGAVILMHDAGGANRDQTLAALPALIAALRAAGYSLAALPVGGLR